MRRQFSASLGGLMTIRAFAAGPQCMSIFLGHLDANARCWYAHLIASRWLGFWLDIMCLTLLFLLCLGAAIQRIYWPASLSPGLVGFAVVHTLALSGVFQWAVRMSAMVRCCVLRTSR